MEYCYVMFQLPLMNHEIPTVNYMTTKQINMKNTNLTQPENNDTRTVAIALK